MWSDIGLVPTEGLPRVLTVDVTPQPVGGSGNDHWFDLPEPMPAGWYLVEVGDGPRPAQAILQVTDVAVYAVATVTDSLVWVNDVSTGQAIESASVTLSSADSLGATDVRGLLRIQTPDSVEGTQAGGEAPGPILVVRDGPNRSAFAPLAGTSGEGFYDPVFGWRSGSDSATDDYWRLFYTDRWRYRADDEVEAWGFVRERGSGRVPDRVQVRVASEAEISQPPLRSTEVRPGADGSFAAKVGLDGLPQGRYRLELWTGDLLLAQTYISVGVIRKPGYQLELSTPRHAYLRGEEVDLTVAASFFEGTPVPGVDLRVDAFGSHTTSTGSDGRVTIHATATSENDGGWCCAYLNANAAGAEEGDITGATELAVFPSSTWLDAEATMADGRLTVRGSARSVDLVDFDRRWTADRYDLEVRGPDLPGARVSASVTELIPERRLVGQAYDFIEKRVVDRYEYSMRERALGTHAMTTGADGAFTLGLPVVADHEHAIILSTSDAAGRTMRLNVPAGPSADELRQSVPRPYLESADVCSGGFREYSTGEALSLTMRDRDGPLPSGGSARYLFAATQRGLREVVVQSDPTLTGRFEAGDAPDVTYLGVYFTGKAYVQVRTFRTALDPQSRALTVELSTGAPRYRPGETATVSIWTLDPTGRGVPATVTLRAIDEKLYAIGAAEGNDPLRDLYQPVSSGLIDSYASHEPPLDTPECGGDTAGGGDDRSDFRDSLGLRQVQTGSDGRATSTFKLSDDLTSWRLNAAAVTTDLHVGQSTVLVPVGLPFFVEPTIAPEYLVDDRPNIRLRAYGSELAPGEPVAFTLESETLGLDATAIEGRAFEALDVPLPALSLGEHSITVSGRAGTGSAMRQDRITRTFRVVASRLRSTVTAYEALTPEYVPPGGEGLTTYSFADAGRGRFLPLLESLATSPGPRVDQAVAADVARKLLIEEFRFEPSRLPADPFNGSAYQGDDGLVALLPFAGGDLSLTAQVAFAAPEGFEGSQLRAAFAAVRVDPQETRERKLLALLGLASLGDPVLGAVHDATADDGLTVRENLYIALAAAALGDDAFALRIGRELLNDSGQRLGPWVRLRVGETLDDTIEATALLALVTAAVGDPLAPLLQAYVDENPPTETLASLEQVTAARLMLARRSSAAARLAYTVTGRRQVVDLAPGETFRLVLTAEQRAGLELESLEGEIGVAASWDVPIRTEELAKDPTLSIERTISPEGDIGDDRTVAVTIRVRFAPQVLRGCYRVVDLAPSGLVPIAREGWPTAEAEETAGGDPMGPWSVEGQRVEFCAVRDPIRPTPPMRYLAHVVSTGSYLWEPAIAQSAEASQSTAYTGARTVTVVASGP